MSRTIFDAPTTCPSSSLIGEIVSETRMRAAVGAHALGLEVLDPPPGLQAGDDLVFLGDAVGRDDERDVAADRLLGRCSRRAARRPAFQLWMMPSSDLLMMRVVRRLDDRREQARGQQLARVVSRSSRRCAVTSRKISTQPETWPSLVPDRRGAVVDRALACRPCAISTRVVRQADDDAFAQRPASPGSRPAGACPR